MRSRSGSSSARVRALGTAALLTIVTMAGCRLFVDLEGLGDGPGPGGGDGSNDTGLDATTSDSTTADSGKDVTTIPDVIEEPLPDGACPDKGGPVMKRVEAGTVSFCIDSTEVTRDQYDAFLKSTPAGGVAECAWKSSAGLTPTDDWPPTPTTKDLPVVYVDWCDAKAFCAWAGKRMCGAVGGGPANNADIQLPAKSEFVFACTGGGTRSYPYGSTYNPNACNGADLAANKTTPVGSLAGCQGGFPGIYDLSGNVHEWLNGCDPSTADASPDQMCAISGNAFTHSASDMICTFIEPIGRSARLNELGFRCCSP